MGNKEIEWRFDPTNSAVWGWTQGNVWSRAARRNPKTVVEKLDDRVKTVDRTVSKQNMEEESKEPREPRFIFRIQVYPAKVKSRVLEVHVRWLAGLDTVMFESFCGFVKSKLGEFSELELDA